jgi:hypothetical protein
VNHDEKSKRSAQTEQDEPLLFMKRLRILK